MKALLTKKTWSKLTERQRTALLRRPAQARRPEVERGVSRILAAVRKDGDLALRRLTRKFDGVTLSSLAVSARERRDAWSRIAPETKRALEIAAGNIEAFHREQLPRPIDVEVAPGQRCRRLARAIEHVGLYAPGGTAPLPSTVLMLALPARLAGCGVRILCTPPAKDGSVDPAILAAADVAGVDRIFRVGGAQAIAAMAYGTRSVPKVDKIFGPGNSWVTEAKQQAARDPEGAPCDMPAGPSEAMVVADGEADPVFVAADLLSQAEHGTDSQVALVTLDAALVPRVEAELARQLATLPRRAIARAALRHAFVVVVGSLDEAMAVSNRYAPEHLLLQIADPEQAVPLVRNAGSVFLGRWTPESVGDYASGTNHVLPTYGYARSMGGLGLSAFLKEITFQELTGAALRALGPTVETLAEVEGLTAHRRAVSLRLERLALERVPRKRASPARISSEGVQFENIQFEDIQEVQP